jgi:hypothetical protein
VEPGLYSSLYVQKSITQKTAVADFDQAIEKKSPHIKDWRIWAEINYLDSPTDYREYLSQNNSQPKGRRGDFVILDTPRRSLMPAERMLTFMVGSIAVLICGYLFLVVVDAIQIYLP